MTQDISDRHVGGTLPRSLDAEETRVRASKLRVAGDREADSTPSSNPAAERAILGAIMWSAQYGKSDIAPATIADVLTPEQFSVRVLALAAKHAWAIDAEKKPTTPLAIHGAAVAAGEALTLDALEALVDSAGPTTAPQFRAHAEVVRTAWAVREGAGRTEQTASALRAGSVAPLDAVASLRKLCDDIERATATATGIVSAKEAAKDFARSLASSAPVGLDTGIAGVDTYLGGIIAPDVTMIAARPSVGKSAFAFQVVDALTDRHPDVAALYVPLEMSVRDFLTRGASSRARVDVSRVRRRLWDEDEMSRTMAAMRDIAAKPIWFADRQSQTTATISKLVEKTATEAMRRGARLRLVVIDHVLLMKRSPAEKGLEMPAFMAEVSRWTNGLAKHFDVAVWALAQISRDSEKQQGERRPQLHHLKWSGAFEENAENAILIHRERKRDGGGFDDSKPAKFYVEKSRMAGTGAFEMKFEPTFTRFAPTEAEEPQYGGTWAPDDYSDRRAGVDP